MLKVTKLTTQSKPEDLWNVQQLYIKAFPANERGSLNILLNDTSNCSEIFTFYNNNNSFCGFISLLTYQDISHILYFAVDDTVRSKGYGTEILEQLKK